jgi:DNA repair exonuclease SbcCD nuclease subunit
VENQKVSHGDLKNITDRRNYMKFAFIADIHLSRYGQDKIEDKSNLPERLHSIRDALYEVGDYCKKNGIPNLVVGGDILHGKSIIYAIAQDIMIQFFEDFNDSLKFYVIDGNHDLSGKGDDVISALRPLEKLHNVHWVKYSETYHLTNEDVLFVPYSNKLPEIIKESRARILISHFGLSEGVLNSGLSIISNVSMKDLEGKFELVLLGHYHKPQEITSNGTRLFYVGSPIQLDWGEREDEKRFLVVDTNTLKVDSIPFQNYKKHIQIEITEDNKDEAIKAAIAAKKAGDHVKVIMKETVDLSEIKGEFNVIDKTDKNITDRGITSNMSTEDKLKRYLQVKEIPEEQHDAYLQVAMEIIRQGDESIT